jgi:hypothetical protein
VKDAESVTSEPTLAVLASLAVTVGMTSAMSMRVVDEADEPFEPVTPTRIVNEPGRPYL